MVDPRTVAAALLGIGLGAVLVAYPDEVIRIQTVGRLPHDRRGPYGESSTADRRWRLLVRALGVLAIGAGLYFGVVAMTGG